ncbi:hypothetical protein GOP47_0003724 [Adiantum capillus-veneris]|uniref:non-specific serine/threonine protein kinase n=1 Tax=Adiantum capillus-veneris TaxID=13818 RepID=A0A9D4V768_ADICA|nr:hypothetical protein GOP47_0003724 [Adiantum capillus-veneris]
MDRQHRRLPAKAIVGILFGVIVGLAFVSGCVLLYVRRRHRQAHSRRTLPTGGGLHGDASMYSCESKQPLHPYSGVFSIFSFWGKSMLDDSSSSSSSSSLVERVSRFTYKELQKATKDFTSLLGRGAFGPVYKATLLNKSIIAVKVLADNSKQGEKEFQNEVLLLGRLHHKNLLSLVGFCSEGGHRILAFDYMTNGSLAARLHDEQYEPLTWIQRVSIAQDVARGIEYLHDGAVPPVIHRDIKASNILLDSYMVARVADFGLSKEADHDMPASGIRGTYGYVDPEYVNTNTLTYKSDVYSFGVLLFELLAGTSPEEGLMEYVEVILMSNGGREIWLQILDPRLKGNCDLKELGDIALIATKCTEIEARKRPKMREVVQALARFGRSESTRLDVLNLPSFKRFERKERADRGMMGRVSSMAEARG